MLYFIVFFLLFSGCSNLQFDHKGLIDYSKHILKKEIQNHRSDQRKIYEECPNPYLEDNKKQYNFNKSFNDKRYILKYENIELTNKGNIKIRKINKIIDDSSSTYEDDIDIRLLARLNLKNTNIGIEINDIFIISQKINYNGESEVWLKLSWRF